MKPLLTCLSVLTAFWPFINTPATAKSPSLLLQEAVHAEQTEGDLATAIGLYKQVLADTKTYQQIAAQATYHLGLCYVKQGDQPQARVYWQELIEGYPKQTSLVARASVQLERLATPEPMHINEAQDLNQRSYRQLSALLSQVSLLSESFVETIARNDFKATDAICKEIKALIEEQLPHIEPSKEKALFEALLPEFDVLHKAIHDSAVNKADPVRVTVSLFKLSNLASQFYTQFQTVYKPHHWPVESAVFAQLSLDVFRHIRTRFSTLRSQAMQRGLGFHSHIYWVDSPWRASLGGLECLQNTTNEALDRRTSLGRAGGFKPSYFDIAGRPMDIEIIADPSLKNTYHYFWTPAEPIGPGQVFHYAWGGYYNHPLPQKEGAERYILAMRNEPVARVYETFFLVTPKAMGIHTHTYSHKEPVGDFMVYEWTTELPYNTPHYVDVELSATKTPVETGD